MIFKVALTVLMLSFNYLLVEVMSKQETSPERVSERAMLADALRAGGLDPNSRTGRNVRRLIERKAAGTNPVSEWDVWALRGLLTFRKKKNPKGEG